MNILKADIIELNNYTENIFLSKEWLSIYNNYLEYYKITNNNNQIIGGFVIYKEKQRFKTTAIKNPPFSPNIGLFINIESSNDSKINNEYKKLLQELSNFLNSHKFNILTISLPSNFIDTQPFFWNKFKVIPNYTYIIDLSESIEQIEKKFSSERRHNINKALKDGIECEINFDYNLIYELIIGTFNRKEKNINENLLNKILFEFANDKNSFSVVSYKNNEAISTSFYVYDKNKIYYLLGGYNNKNKHYGAGTISILTAIKHSKKLNIPIFDFEGSMIPEVEKYFRGFGGKLTPYYTINKGKFLMEIYMKLKGSSIF